MIESIRISDIATFTNISELKDLSQFNFIFGANGSGKTTISRVIADISRFPSCSLTWSNGTALQTMAYNRDFVEENFSQSSDLKGIFTLGEKDIDTLNKIKTAKAALDILEKDITGLKETLIGSDGTGGKKGELQTIEDEFKETCWKQKQKHDVKFSSAFEGFRNDKKKFMDKVLLEQKSNTATLEDLAILETRANKIFGSTPIAENLVPILEPDILIAHESNSILKKRILGKEDVDISAMIHRLNNSDWVKQGRAFYDANEKICPFCQQSTADAFAQSLNEYFDESFEKNSNAIADLETNYKTESARIQNQLALLLSMPSEFLDTNKLASEKEILDSKIAINIQLIATKKKEPSRIIDLESIANVILIIKGLIDETNAKIIDHNNMVKNLLDERSKLKAQVWKYLLDRELKNDITTYEDKKINLNRAISSIEKQIKAKSEEKVSKTHEIRLLEKQTTSVQPTIDDINLLLKSFGFTGFALARAGDEMSYKLVRHDKSDVKDTLSEGEKTFIAFLYFYHLLQGSHSESGMTTNRVVVIDDPVSSLDSDILFIVASLIKKLFKSVRNGDGHIKQVFVLTHNVYFHKEVTFNTKREKKKAMSEETFWIVRKPGHESIITRENTNPIKTSYELLWNEVKNPDRATLTIQNTLRRILENYFKILGGIDLDDIYNEFSEKDQLICKTLLSWVHDGSHNALEDLYISIEESSVESYLRVFKSIFEKKGQIAHYNLMMRETA